MNADRLRYAEVVELLTEGPVGGRRDWAALLVLRMLETRAAATTGLMSGSAARLMPKEPLPPCELPWPRFHRPSRGS